MGKNLALFCAEVILALSWYLFLFSNVLFHLLESLLGLALKPPSNLNGLKCSSRALLIGDADFAVTSQFSMITIKKKPSSVLTSATWSILKHNYCSLYFRLHSGESATPEEIKEFCKGQVSQWTVLHSESYKAFFNLIRWCNVLHSFSDFSF